MNKLADGSAQSSKISTSSASTGVVGSRKMSVIEGIRKKAKRELEFQLHAFETKSRFVRDNDAKKKFTPSRRNVKLSADDEKELRKAMAHERKIRHEKQRLLNRNKRHKVTAEERFPEYSLENPMEDPDKERKSVQKRKLNKLHRNLDINFVRKCLPRYNGDLFGTRRTYLDGILYMSRMTAAQEHKSRNPWGDSNRLNGEGGETRTKKIEFIDEKRKVVKSLCNLSWHESNCEKLVREGGLEALSKLSKIDDPEIRINCSVAFHNLCRNKDTQRSLMDYYVVESVVNLSNTDGEASSVILSHCIAALSWLSATPGYEALLVHQGALKVLDKLISMPLEEELELLVVKTLLNLTTCFDEQTSYPGVDSVIKTCRDVMASVQIPSSSKMYAARALNNLVLYENHRARIISEGMVRDLSDFHEEFASNPAVSTSVVDDLEGSIASTLNHLSACTGELKAAVIRQNAVQLLVKISKSRNHSTRQSCILALNNLAMDTHGDGRAAGQVLEPVIALCDSENFTTRLRCAGALRSMSKQLGSRKQMIKLDIFKVLNRLIDFEINRVDGKDVWSLITSHCTITLCNLLLYTDTRTKALECNTVERLQMLMSRTQHNEEKQKCCNTIYILTRYNSKLNVLVTPESLRLLQNLLRASNEYVTKVIVKSLRILCMHKSTCKRFQAVEPDPIPAVTKLFSSSSDEVVIDTLILCSLLVNSTTARRRVVDAGIESIIQLCTHDNTKIQMWAAAIITSLTFAPSCRVKIVRAGATRGLNIVSNIKDDVNLSRCSIAFCNLSAEVACRKQMINEGVATSLIALASAHHESIRFNCCKALCNLSCEVSREIDLVQAGALPELMITALVRSEYPITKLTCIKTIANLIADDTIAMLLEQGMAWAITAATTPEFAEADEPLEDGLQLAGDIYCVLASYEEGIQKIIDESGVLRSLAVLMKSKNSTTRFNAWKVLKAACRHPCQSRLMEENFLNILTSMKVESDLTIAQNISALLSFLFRDKNIRRIIAADGIGVVKKIYRIDDTHTSMQCMEALARLCCDSATTALVVKTGGLEMLHVLSLRKSKQTRFLCLNSLLHVALFQENIGALMKEGMLHVVAQLVVGVDDNSIEELTMAIAILNSMAWGHPHACVEGYGIVNLDGKVSPEDRLHYKLLHGGILKIVDYIWKAIDIDEMNEHLQRDIASILGNIIYHENKYYSIMLEQGVLPILTILAKLGDEYTKDLCFTSLHNIGLHKHAHIQLIDAGVVEALVEFLHEGTDNALLKRQNVVATLCNLSHCLDRGEFLVECGVYDLMVAVGNTSDKFIRKCCGTILSICSVHAKETKDGSVSALLELCLPKASEKSKDETIQSPNVRAFGTQAATKQEENVRQLNATMPLNVGSWELSYDYFLENFKTFTSKVPKAMQTTFGNDDENETYASVWAKEEAGSASGPLPQFPEVDTGSDDQIDNQIINSDSDDNASPDVEINAVEQEARKSQEQKPEGVKYEKVVPVLKARWYDAVTAVTEVGRRINVADSYYNSEANEDYDLDDDFFDEDVEDPKTIRENSGGKTREGEKSTQAKLNQSNAKRPSTSAKSMRERQVNTGESSSAIAYERSSINSSDTRLPSSSVEEIMEMKKLTIKNTPNNQRVRDIDDYDEKFEEGSNDSNEQIHLLGAEGSREDVRTPSLHFVDNANYAGLWSDTPKIQWEKPSKKK